MSDSCCRCRSWIERDQQRLSPLDTEALSISWQGLRAAPSPESTCQTLYAGLRIKTVMAITSRGLGVLKLRNLLYTSKTEVCNGRP